MTDSSAEEPVEAGNGKPPEEPELRGRYVEGDYGKTGTHPGRHSEDEEGQYAEGDYGADGTVGPLRSLADETSSAEKPPAEKPPADAGANGQAASADAEGDG